MYNKVDAIFTFDRRQCVVYLDNVRMNGSVLYLVSYTIPRGIFNCGLDVVFLKADRTLAMKLENIFCELLEAITMNYWHSVLR